MIIFTCKHWLNQQCWQRKTNSCDIYKKIKQISKYHNKTNQHSNTAYATTSTSTTMNQWSVYFMNVLLSYLVGFKYLSNSIICSGILGGFQEGNGKGIIVGQSGISIVRKISRLDFLVRISQTKNISTKIIQLNKYKRSWWFGPELSSGIGNLGSGGCCTIWKWSHLKRKLIEESIIRRGGGGSVPSLQHHAAGSTTVIQL